MTSALRLKAQFALDAVQTRTFKSLQDEAMKDLIRSIRSNGFLAIERIIVAPYNEKDGTFLVLEGNRRVAALQILSREMTEGVDMSPSLKETFLKVPCFVANNQKEPYFKEMLMGIRHVGGIKKWSGYQEAKLITDLTDRYSLAASDIADRLGMNTPEVTRRYRAFKALQQMQDDDVYADFAKPHLYSLFHEAVALPTVRKWLG